MIWAIPLLIFSVPTVFVGIYFSSRSSSVVKSSLWSLLAILSLVAIAASIVRIAIPNFFTGA